MLNKIDRLNDPERAMQALQSYPNSVAISALTGQGIPDLLQTVSERLFETFSLITVRLPYAEGGLIAMFHELGQVERLEHGTGGVTIQGRIPGRLLARYAPFVVKGQNPA